MLNRRDFLKASAAVGASVYAAGCSLDGQPVSLRSPQTNEPPPPPTITKFADELPIPGVVEPSGRYYRMTLSQFEQRLHSDFDEATVVWGYNGSYPGPTIEARRGVPIVVQWRDDLPTDHLFNVIHDVHGAGTQYPDVRNVTHLHGAAVPPQSDGYPEAWIVPGSLDTAFYPNTQRATTLWYHDHALGITRLNVYAGLAGFYLLRDAEADALDLPSGPYEIPIVFQDRTFTEEGQLWYPQTLEPEFFGNTAVVNGRVWPYLEVEPRAYRFRMLDGSNSRFYRMRLFQSDPTGLEVSSTPGPNFHIIGTDGGLLSEPVTRERLLIAPGMRYDVIMDFSGHAGEYFVLRNNAPSPFGGEPDTDGQPNGDDFPLPDIMQFKVKSTSSTTFVIPETLSDVPRLTEGDADVIRRLTLVEKPGTGGEGEPPLTLLLGTLPDHPLGLEWDDPVTENIQRGDVEIWELYNYTPDTHPIHLHLVQFQILNRQQIEFSLDDPSNPTLVGDRVAPEPYERGWHDIVMANPGQVTRIIVPFDSGYTGTYVWHCHILEHEDHEMMRPMTIHPGRSQNSGGGQNRGRTGGRRRHGQYRSE